MKKILFYLIFIGYFLPIQAQNLARRAFLGAQLETVNEEVKRTMNLPQVTGALISRVIPQSTAEAAGLQKGDVLLKIGEKIVNSPQEAVTIVRETPAGQTLNFHIFRQGKNLIKKSPLKTYPTLSSPDFELIYSEVKAQETLLRTILTKPRVNGKAPAVLFIQGVGCYSLDTPLDTNSVENQLMNYFTRKGFITMRVDKSGMGDSKGISCGQLDFKTEQIGYQQALIKLKTLDYVDTDNIFLIGHSMGGVMAPLVAQNQGVRGIIAYGAITANFMEYYYNSRRTIAQAFQMSPEEADAYVKLACECGFKLLIDKMTPEAIFQQNPDCQGHTDLYQLRSKAFWEQLIDLNLASEWKKFEGKVLAAWGKADYISTRIEHQQLAEMINYYHKGNGTFMELENCDHGMNIASDFVEAQKLDNNTRRYNTKVAPIFYQWMKDNLKSRS